MEVVTLPKLGISDEGELIAWEVEVGESVSEDDLLVTFESDKATAEVTATADGVLLETYLNEGDIIPIEPGRPIAVIGDPDDEPPSYAEVSDDGTPPSHDAEPAATATNEGSTADDPPTGNGGASDEDIKATPRAKRYAESEGVSLKAVAGTGPQGAITEDDVIAFQESTPTDESTAGGETAKVEGGDVTVDGDTGDDGVGQTEDGPTVVERRELSGTRRTIAERLSESAREKPHVTGTRKISIEESERFRERVDGHKGWDVSLNDVILFAVTRTLADLPAFNARYVDGTHELLAEVNVGYAVDTPKGLVVPVLRNLGEKDIGEIGAERRANVERVRNDEHTPADLQGGTFTVTNVGALGIDASYSIIDPPQVAILAIGRRRPAAFERDGEAVLERAITFSLTIDHRVLDGADSGAFLDRLDEYLQHPYRLLTHLPEK